jgi:hypothetical protein
MPFKQSVGLQEKHAVATLHRNQIRLACDGDRVAEVLGVGRGTEYCPDSQHLHLSKKTLYDFFLTHKKFRWKWEHLFCI